MSVILIEQHNKIVKQLKRRARRVLTLSTIFAFLLGSLLTPLTSTVSTKDKTYQRMQILDMVLRDKTLTIGDSIFITDTVIEKTSHRVGLPMVLAIMSVESQFTINCRSFRNCRGLMQLSPVVWKIFMGETAFKDFKNAYNPALNITVAIRYLEDLYEIYHGDWDKILRYYHSGDSGAKASGFYVEKVLVRAEQYQRDLK